MNLYLSLELNLWFVVTFVDVHCSEPIRPTEYVLSERFSINHPSNWEENAELARSAIESNRYWNVKLNLPIRSLLICRSLPPSVSDEQVPHDPNLIQGPIHYWLRWSSRSHCLLSRLPPSLGVLCSQTIVYYKHHCPHLLHCFPPGLWTAGEDKCPFFFRLFWNSLLFADNTAILRLHSWWHRIMSHLLSWHSFQGSTIRPLVGLLDVKRKGEQEPTVSVEIASRVSN